MTSLDLYKLWHGCDGYRCSLPTLQVLRLYHLMAGGVTQWPVLAIYSGVNPHRLRRMDLHKLFLSADDSWLLFRRVVPTVDLPPGRTVVCRRCRQTLRQVPCMTCPADLILGDE